MEITDSQDNVIFSGTQQATSNDFGVLQLSVGDADTFNKADTGKMPFFISVTVDGLLIGKSQILSVPVAEVANKMKSSFTKEFLIGTWKANTIEWTSLFQFNEDMTMVWTLSYSDGYSISDYYTYEIDGNTIWCYCLKGTDESTHIEIIRKTDNRLFHETEGFLTKL